MNATQTPTHRPDRTIPRVSLPRSALATLSHRCAELGSDGVRALREAGYRAGREVLSTLSSAPDRLSVTAFWCEVDAELARAGLGSVSFRTLSPSIGSIAWIGSCEAEGPRARQEGTRCHFAAGLLGGVLSPTAGRTVDVLEVACGSEHDEPCWFVFGSVSSLSALYRSRLPEGPAAP